MADSIVAEASSSLDRDAPPDDLKLVCFGDLPKGARTEFRAVPGKWHVTVSSRGPVLATLGVIADGFCSKRLAETWRDALPRDQYGDYWVSVEYTPTPSDLERIRVAPEILHVPSVVIEFAQVLNDGALGQRYEEEWASRDEARARIRDLEARGARAELAGRRFHVFSPDPQSLLERDDCIRRINGDTTSLKDGSAWWHEDFSDWRWRVEGRRPGWHPGPYSLTAYTLATVRSIKGVAHSKTGVYAKPVSLGEFPSREEAEAAGYRLLAEDDSVFAFLSWPLVIPDTDPPLAYIARSNREAGGRVIPRSRLTDFFEGASRYEDARAALKLLMADWPDAAVFFAHTRSQAVRRSGQGTAASGGGK